jgi:RNA polymerase sigma-70 factor (ECF subfamily)
LVQDAFVRAFRSLDGFREEAKFGTWLISILHNLCLTHIGRRKVREVPLEQLEGGREPASADDTDILDRLDQDERLRRLRVETMRLPVQYREVLTLFYVQELSYEEIAGVTGLPIGTVKTHLFRARSSLKNVLQKRTHKEVAGV